MKTLREVLSDQVTAKLRKRGLSEEEIEQKKAVATMRLADRGKPVRK